MILSYICGGGLPPPLSATVEISVAITNSAVVTRRILRGSRSAGTWIASHARRPVAPAIAVSAHDPHIALDASTRSAPHLPGSRALRQAARAAVGSVEPDGRRGRHAACRAPPCGRPHRRTCRPQPARESGRAYGAGPPHAAGRARPRRGGHELPGHIVGITGPPGAGKSTLLGALITEWRRRGRTVALLAVDPSSKRSGGALLGDRARLYLDPEDRGAYVRSMASAGQLGGLAPATRAAAHALAACFDVVVVETVGVGQSETEIAEVADTTAVIVQPASGDALQFLKSGIMEVPDVLVVTKADLGIVAQRARRDLLAALRSIGDHDTEVVLLSSVSTPPLGIGELIDALDRHRARIDLGSRRIAARRASALATFTREYGERSLRALGGLAARPTRSTTLTPPSMWNRSSSSSPSAAHPQPCETPNRAPHSSFRLSRCSQPSRSSPRSPSLLGPRTSGPALTFGQVAFGIVLVALLLRPTARGTDGSDD